MFANLRIRDFQLIHCANTYSIVNTCIECTQHSTLLIHGMIKNN